MRYQTYQVVQTIIVREAPVTAVMAHVEQRPKERTLHQPVKRPKVQTIKS
jgi:hypothetical protein